jgi:hypothetical protein
MDHQQIQRMKVHWKKGRDNYTSFFTLLNEVRNEIGDAALPGWCIDKLHISLGTINEMIGVLKEADQLAIREELARARKAEHQQRGARRGQTGVAQEFLSRDARRQKAKELYHRGWTMERIATKLNVSQPTITRDLEGLFTMNKPPRPKGGRPKK